MRIWTSLAVLAAIVGIVVTSVPASAWQNCTTTCNNYGGGNRSCTRSCF
jgi:hypothetical protein